MTGARPIQPIIDGLPVGSFHRTLLALTCTIVIFDGFDIQLTAFAAPTIMKQWALPPGALAPAMAAGLVGMAVGTGLGGWLGDRLGRRWTLIASVLWFGMLAMATALAQDVTQLAVLRLLTGLGLGAAVPNAAALVAECFPSRQRSYAVTAIIVAMPCGGMLGAGLAVWLIPAHGWRAAFATGGALPLLLGVALFAALPESPAFLALREAHRPLLRLLRRAGAYLPDDATFAREAQATGAGEGVFAAPFRRSAIGLGLGFFASMLALYAYLSWIPVVLTAAGLSPAQAIAGSMIFNLCGVAASFAAVPLVMALGTRRSILLSCLLASLATLGFAAATGAVEMSAAAMLGCVGLAGAGVFPVQILLYGLAAHIFPAAVRARGIGYSASVGRIGAIVSTFSSGIVLGLPHGRIAYFAILLLAFVLTAIGMVVVDRHAPGRDT